MPTPISSMRKVRTVRYDRLAVIFILFFLTTWKSWNPSKHISLTLHAHTIHNKLGIEIRCNDIASDIIVIND